MTDQPNSLGAAPAKDLRILLVDDETDVRGAIAMLLELDGHDVTQAASGPDAISELSEKTFHVLITDYRMQEMMGDELAGKVKERWPKMPVLMLTGFVPNLPGVNNPVDGLIFKPASLDSLRTALAQVCPLSGT